MTPKNARTEAGGVLVQFAGGAPEFQREITFGTHVEQVRGSLSLGQDRTESDWNWAEEGGNQERIPEPIGDVCDRCDRRGHGRAGALDGNFSIRDIINAVVPMDSMGG
jgi:hypothetical protein